MVIVFQFYANYLMTLMFVKLEAKIKYLAFFSTKLLIFSYLIILQLISIIS